MAEILPIVDAHVHLWNPEQFSMPWLAGIPRLHRPYGLQDYREQTQGLPIIGMVYIEVGVEPQEALHEARHVADLARDEPRLQAIVAAAPVERGLAVRGHLGSLVAISPLIKGVRRNLQAVGRRLVRRKRGFRQSAPSGCSTDRRSRCCSPRRRRSAGATGPLPEAISPPCRSGRMRL